MAHGYRESWKENKCRNEMWGKRLGNKSFPPRSRYTKVRTHRLERLAIKNEVRVQLQCIEEPLEQNSELPEPFYTISESDMQDWVKAYEGRE